jgi:hypothetical protein
MTLPPESELSPESAETIGLPPMRLPRLSVQLDRSQMPRSVAVLGISLVSAAVVISASHSRQHGGLDSSNFTMGVLSTIGLLIVTAGSAVRLPEGPDRSLLVSWAGAAGALGTGLMLAVLIDKDPAAIYAGAGVVVALSVGGYVATRAGSFVLTTIVGLALLYGQVFADVIDPSGDGKNTFMIVGAAILVFVLVVTAVGWALPETRLLSSIVVGAGGLAAYAVVFQAVAIARVFSTFSSESFPVPGPSSSGGIETFPPDGSAAELDPRGLPDFQAFQDSLRDNPYRDDVYAILAFCAVLAAAWLVCSLATGHVGFRVLVLASGILAVPAATMALVVEHPTWWEVASCALGALILLGSGLAVRGRPAADPAPGH